MDGFENKRFSISWDKRERRKDNEWGSSVGQNCFVSHYPDSAANFGILNEE